MTFWAGATLAALLFFGCSRPESTLVELIPGDSCAVVLIDWPSLSADRELKKNFKGNDLEVIFQRLSLNPSTVKSLAIFSALGSQTKAGLLVRGSFDKQSQIAVLKSKGWHDESVGGQKVLANGTECIAFLRSNVIFAGARGVVERVFQVLKNPSESFAESPPYRKLSASLTTKTMPVKAFLVVPEGTLDVADAALAATGFALSLFDLDGIGAVLKQLTIARGFGFTLRGAEQTYSVELSAFMRDERAAALVSGSLNGLKGLSSWAASRNHDEEAMRALREISVTRNKEMLSIKMAVSRNLRFAQSP